MSLYRIRLVESVTNQATADFAVDAQTLQDAARIVASAHAEAQAAGTNIVRLPDGQMQILESEAATDRVTRFLLVSPNGETSHIPMPSGPSRTQ